MEDLREGIKVRVINDLSTSEKYRGVNVNEDMLNFKGKCVTIARVYSSWQNPSYKRCRIVEDDAQWTWDMTMFVSPELTKKQIKRIEQRKERKEKEKEGMYYNGTQI